MKDSALIDRRRGQALEMIARKKTRVILSSQPPAWPFLFRGREGEAIAGHLVHR